VYLIKTMPTPIFVDCLTCWQSTVCKEKLFGAGVLTKRMPTPIFVDCLTCWQSTICKEKLFGAGVLTKNNANAHICGLSDFLTVHSMQRKTVWYRFTNLKQCQRSCFRCRFIWIMRIETFVNEVNTLVTIYKVVFFVALYWILILGDATVWPLYTV
jgi:hypothetical protein